jgi:hypothetical protein
MPSHWAKNCSLTQKKNNQGNVHRGYAHFTTIEQIPAREVVTAGKFLVNNYPTVVLFDSSALHSFISPSFASKFDQRIVTLDKGRYCISAAENNIATNQLVMDACINIEGHEYTSHLVVLPGLGIDVILGMNWMSDHGVLIDTSTHVVMLRDPINNEAFLVQLPRDLALHNAANAVLAKAITNVPVVCEFLDVFPNDLPRLPPDCDVEFKIELIPSTTPNLGGLIE